MPLLSVDQFRAIIQYHPFHYWGLANQIVPVTSSCNDIVAEYNYQNADGVGRQNILEAIATAEERLTEQLGFSPAPHYVTETLPWPRYMDKRVERMNSVGADGRWLSANLKEGYIQALGNETYQAIETVNLVYSDSDGDGVNDTFVATTTLTTTETNPDYIGLYVSGIYRLNGDGVSETWRLVPTKVTINGNGTVTVRGKAWIMVQPILYQGAASLPFGALDPSDPNNFMTTADVYRHYPNMDGQSIADSQAVLTWETEPWPDWGACCGGSSSVSFANSSHDPAATASVVARAGIRDAEKGIIHAAYSVYDSTNGVWIAANWGLCRPPDRMTVRYLAGWPLKNGEMDKKWQVVVARLAAAELANRLCACDAANRELYKWQFDLSRAAGANDEQYRIGDADLNNPFGTLRGQVYAWKVIQDERLLEGFAF